MKQPISEVTCEDCMEMMSRYPDKYFDLAIVDPPYGGGQHFNFRFGTGDAVYDNIAPPRSISPNYLGLVKTR